MQDEKVEQLTNADERLDATILAEDKPEEPVVETPKVEEPAPQETPAEPVVETPEPEPVAEPEPEEPKRVPLDKFIKARKKAQELQKRNAELQRQNQELLSRQAKVEDPLAAWKKIPENEGLVVPDEVLQQHDAYVVAQAQRPQVVQIDAARKAQVNEALSRAPVATQVIVKLADDRGWITEQEVQEIMLAPDPAAKAFEISRDHLDTFGTEEDAALLTQLFQKETQPKPPAVAPAAPKAKAPVAQKPAPAPKPKETTDEEAEYEPPGFTNHQRDMVKNMFRR